MTDRDHADTSRYPGEEPVDVPMKQPGEKPALFDNPRNVKIVIYGLFVVCAIVVLLDATYHKHVHFSLENVFGFYGFYGLIACVSLVLAAKVLRLLIMREEDYYDR